MNDLSARIEILFYNLARDNFRAELCDGFYKQKLHIITMEVEFLASMWVLFFLWKKKLKLANIYFADENFVTGKRPEIENQELIGWISKCINKTEQTFPYYW